MWSGGYYSIATKRAKAVIDGTTPLGLPDWAPGKSVEEQRDVSLRENVKQHFDDLTLFNRKREASYE
jgi:hypothetical protein